MFKNFFSRTGIAVPVALVLVSVLSVFIASLMQFSGSELRHVKRHENHRVAEYLAYAGIEYATARLDEGRWWTDTPFPSQEGQTRASGGTLTSPGDFTLPSGVDEDQARITIIAEEFSANEPLEYFMDPVTGQTFESAHLLDHIRVLSIAEYGIGSTKHRVMLYGKYIMSPSPLLNCYTTDAPVYRRTGADGTVYDPDNLPMIIPEIPVAGDYPRPETLTVAQIFKQPGDTITRHCIIAELLNDTTSQTVPVRGGVNGRVNSLFFTAGETVRVGDNFGFVKDEEAFSIDVVNRETLKKMVRVTKIDDPAVYNLSIERFENDFATRRQLLDPYIVDLSREYVFNYRKNLGQTERIERAFVNANLGMTVEQDEILSLLSSVPSGLSSVNDADYQAAAAYFIFDMMDKWSIPGLSRDCRIAFPEGSRYRLDQSPPGELPDEIWWVYNELFNIDLNDYVSKPEENPELYDISDTERYKELLELSASITDHREFIRRASEIRPAAHTAGITHGMGWEDDTFRDHNDPIYWPHRDGYYCRDEFDIMPVTGITARYIYANEQQDFKMEMFDVLDFLRKHYDDGGASPPGGPHRLDSDIIDRPLRPGGPDSGGGRRSATF